MPEISARPRFSAPASTAMLLAVFLALGTVAALAESEIRSPEDAACRLEARARVFSTPNPRGLEPEQIGRQIYYACMRRVGQPAVQPRRHPMRRHHHRHRRP